MEIDYRSTIDLTRGIPRTRSDAPWTGDETAITRPDRWRDAVWIAVLLASFVVGLAVSWQRWGNPVVDVGREMNQPLRLVHGETLYTDVRHIYGPLSPWLHAGLYRLFGPSLNVLYADGIVTATLMLGLVYWLGRQIMSPEAAGASTLSMMWLCVFKPAGNYILPYSYNSLHSAALGLIALTILVAALRRTHATRALSGRSGHGETDVDSAPHLKPADQQPGLMPFLAAGFVAGLAVLAKTEVGVASVAGGVATALLVAYPNVRRGVRLAAAFLACAGLLTLGVYTAIAARVGWSVLLDDSWLLLYNMAPELAYFNSQISGFSQPLKSIGRMTIAVIKLGVLAAIIASASMLIAGRRSTRPAADQSIGKGAAHAGTSRAWRILGGSVALLIVMSITTGGDWDKGPYLAMPILLVGILVALITGVRRERPAAVRAHDAMLMVYAVYALASLARMILHVRSGGAYASYVLPLSVVMFTYLWVGPFADRLRNARAAAVARTIALTLIIVSAIGAAIVLAVRYRTRSTAAIVTARGTMVTPPDMAQAMNEALAYIERHTHPGDAVAVMPEGTSLNFFSGRRNPLREEITTPGFLEGAFELRAIQQLRDARPTLILIANRPTAEFGAAAFGRDYSQRLMRWIEEHYQPCAVFGPVKTSDLQIGDQPFFIRAYCRVGPQS